MARLIKKWSGKVGSPPGTMEFVGEQKVEEVTITLMDYDEKVHEFKDIESVDELTPYRAKPGVSWVNVYGLHETDLLDRFGRVFDIHPLVLEDIVHTDQRPKAEISENYIFLVLKMIGLHADEEALNVEQISLIMGSNFVLCFQERKGDFFNPIRERITSNLGQVRRSGTDYLTYRIMDIVVDHYFLVLEKIGDRIEDLEDKVLAEPDPVIVQNINHLKRDLIFLRKSIWPLREVLSGIERGESTFFKKKTMPYIRDLYDHTIQVIDTLESYRDMVSGLLDIYMSSVSNRMNEVMKVLTIIATIFIPLTFLAGIYGMNFEFMPELKWKWSYPVLLSTMAGVFFAMLFYFRKRKWL